ncbi:MAG TPA: DNA alkylation repair protein [Pyrinomonadaceae bacterium]|nr:DNA alkylation repair protein [Pyrinomonadaceae bacterium]
MTAEIRARVGALTSPTTAGIRGVRREFSKRLTKSETQFVFDLALSLMKLPGFEFRFIAYELVQHHRGAFASLNTESLEKLGEGIDSWVAVDCFGCYLAGPAWREQQINDSVIRRWARAKDRWWRRAALVSTVALNNKARGGTGDPEATLMICRLLISDRDDMVVKALSWALRELSKRDPESVRKFLHEHEEKLAARVVREVENKLKTGLKNPR